MSLVISGIEVKHYDLTNASVIEINLDKGLIKIFDTIKKECDENGYTIDEFICSLIENETKNHKSNDKMTIAEILNANIQC